MPEDKFKSFDIIPNSPLASLEEITPSDTADLAVVTRAVNAASAGTLRITTVTGDTGTITVGAGTFFPIRITRIWATGTTATGIVGLS